MWWSYYSLFLFKRIDNSALSVLILWGEPRGESMQPRFRCTKLWVGRRKSCISAFQNAAPTTAGAGGQSGLSFWILPSVRQDACRREGTIQYFQKEAWNPSFYRLYPSTMHRASNKCTFYAPWSKVFFFSILYLFLCFGIWCFLTFLVPVFVRSPATCNCYTHKDYSNYYDDVVEIKAYISKEKMVVRCKTWAASGPWRPVSSPPSHSWPSSHFITCSWKTVWAAAKIRNRLEPPRTTLSSSPEARAPGIAPL